MLYALEKVAVVGSKGDGKPAAAPVISRQVGKVDRLVMLHCLPHVSELFILIVGTIGCAERPLRNRFAGYSIQGDRITPAATVPGRTGADATPSTSSFSLSPMLMRPCRAAVA